MMESISLQEFLVKQPNFPQRDPAEVSYCKIANEVLKVIAKSEAGMRLDPALVKRMALGFAGYLQDIVADAGIWRSFVDANRKLYGYSVPFHSEGESYVDYELNREDIRFLSWYFIAMNDESLRDLYPHDPLLLSLADQVYEYFESVYDDAPNAAYYNISLGLELSDPEDSEKIFHLGQWLFLHCYLMTPAFALTLSGILSDEELMKSKDITKLQNRMEQSMMEDPTGPLSLFVTEWLKLIIEGKMPEDKNSTTDESKEPHPYYAKFMNATGGKPIRYFGDYEEMNMFFIEGMGWEANQEHLPQMKNEHDFVIMVNRNRGMLVARNVARCIADPDNPYYDKAYAREHAFDFLTVRGRCPADLVRYAFHNSWLPDAVFPGTDDNILVAANNDFIARCYLQQYYRD